MEIMPGIRQFKSPIPEAPPTFLLNSYLLQGTDGWLLIDTGWNTPETTTALERELTEAGASLTDISQVVITHLHPDHFGLAKQLHNISGAEVTFHQAEKPFLEYVHSNFRRLEEFLQEGIQWLCRHGIPQEMHPAFQMASLGFFKEFLSAPLPQNTVSGGEKLSTGLFELEVVWTPGHSPGHICLYEPDKKLLFSGDHLLPITTPVVTLYDESGSNPLSDFLNSLQLLENLEIELVLPGHENVFTGVPRRVAELQEHHQKRGEVMVDALKDGGKTIYDIASRTPWTGPNRSIVYLDQLSLGERWLALTETLAHLHFLMAEGKVERASPQGVCYYSQKR